MEVLNLLKNNVLMDLLHYKLHGIQNTIVINLKEEQHFLVLLNN